jgi:D-tyrosyl-tRNA(Tyr) deacylase
MRALVQRVSRAEVRVAGRTAGAIGAGLVVLLGATHEDGVAAADWTARKVAELRILSDPEGRMNLSLLETGGAVLLVPQFTLYGDARRGRRPEFVRAARPEHASPLVDRVAERLTGLGITVARGVFGAHMEVELVNDGPVTLWLESPDAPAEKER